MACGRLAVAAALSRLWARRSNAGSCDDLAHPAAARHRDASGCVFVGAGTLGSGGIAEGQDDRSGRDDTGSERGDALDRAACDGRELSRVSGEAGRGGWRSERPGGVRAKGPQAQQEAGFEQGLGESARPRSRDHEDEGRAHAAGLQGRAGGGPGHGSDSGDDGACGCDGRHDIDPTDPGGGGRSGGRTDRDGAASQRSGDRRSGDGQGLSQWGDVAETRRVGRAQLCLRA